MHPRARFEFSTRRLRPAGSGGSRAAGARPTLAQSEISGMKLCLIGKYPPIEGGVSTLTYWMARGLAQRGHDVHVVTNADEVEATFRMTLEADDEPLLELTSESSGGRVRVYQPEPFSP